MGAVAVLLHENAVSFFSWKFNRDQLNYSVVEKEALVLVWALQHFDIYDDSEVPSLIAFTDHNPLTFFPAKP